MMPVVRAILTYHSIDSSGSAISVSEEVFREHVRFLASGAVRAVSLAEVLALPPDADAVALTFDDAFANFESAALPQLAEHGIPATLFVVSGHAGGTNAWGGVAAPGIPTLPLMTWDAVRRAAAAGVEIGSHTQRHRRLTQLAPEEIHDEVAGAVDRITREIGRRPESFAYPYGAVSDRVASVVRTVASRACTTELRALVSADSPIGLPRLDMYYCRSAGQLEAWGSPAFRRRMWLRAQGRRVREMVFQSGAMN